MQCYSGSELFTAEHQQRILKRLEKLESELHKKVSDLDKFWGLIGDADVAIRKFGKNAKPIVDRIKEMQILFGEHKPMQKNYLLLLRFLS